MRKIIAVAAVLGALTLGACTTQMHGSAQTTATNTGSSGNTGNTGSSLQSWWSSVQSDAHAIGSDGNQISTDANNNDQAAVQSDCQSLLTDTQAAQSDPAVPNTLMQVNWSSALSDYAAGAQACINGDFNTATSDLDNGNNQLTDLANAISNAIG